MCRTLNFKVSGTWVTLKLDLHTVWVMLVIRIYETEIHKYIFIICILRCILVLLEVLECPSTQQLVNKTDINVLIFYIVTYLGACVTYWRFLDWRPDLLHPYTTCYYTSQTTIWHTISSQSSSTVITILPSASLRSSLYSLGKALTENTVS
jgi:hypothetical protein